MGSLRGIDFTEFGQYIKSVINMSSIEDVQFEIVEDISGETLLIKLLINTDILAIDILCNNGLSSYREKLRFGLTIDAGQHGIPATFSAGSYELIFRMIDTSNGEAMQIN